MLITSTAAEVARDGQADFLVCGIGIFFEPGFERHQEAGRAETALQAVLLVEGLLDGMQVFEAVNGEALDREEIMAIRLHREHQAGAHGLAVEQDGASAAHAVLAADVGAGQAEVLADEVAQKQPGFDRPLVGCAIDIDGDVHFFAHFAPPGPAICADARPKACVNACRPSTEIKWRR